MLHSLVRYLSLALLAIAALAEPALARDHSAARAVYGHHHQASAHRHYAAHYAARSYNGSRRRYAAQSGAFGAPSGEQSAPASGPAEPQWQPPRRAARSRRERQNFSGFPPVAQYQDRYRGEDADRYSGRYPQRYARQYPLQDDGYVSGQAGRRGALERLVAQAASANGVPVSLVHRVIMRESGYNPRAVSSGNYGLMQIRLGTARAMGYNGSAAGLLDPATNMTYAVRYLAGAYRAAGGNESGAVALYARGYNAAPVQRYRQYAYDAPAGDAPQSWNLLNDDQPRRHGMRVGYRVCHIPRRSI